MSKVKYKWPDNFLYHNAFGVSYVARKNAVGMYNIYRVNDPYSALQIDVPIENFQKAFETGAIKILTEGVPEVVWCDEDEPIQKDKRSITINVNSVFHAAKWDVENNPFAKKRGDTIEIVQDHINDIVQKLYNEAIEESWEYRSCSTGSYTVMFQPEDENYGTISVLVDPSVGQNAYYVDVSEYLEQI